MPPFVYRSLKDFMRASATAKTRQELLQKLITNAAKRKTQTHLDATGARMSTFPEMFGRSLAADMGKQAFMGAGLKMVGRGISNFARNQLSGGLGKFVGNIGNGVRGLGTQTQRAGLRLGNAAQPLVNEVKDMSNQVINRGLEQADRLPPWALPAAGGAVIGGRVADEINDANELRRPSPLFQNKPQRQQGGLMANPIQETYSMNMGKQSMNKQANPLRGPAAKSVQMALQKIVGGLKTYGKRMTGNSTLKPMQTRGKLLDELEQQIASSAKPLVDLAPLKQKSKLVQDMLDGVRDQAHGYDPSSSPLGGKYFRDLFEARMRPTRDKIQQHKSLFPGKSTSSTIQSQQQALTRARAGAAQVSETARRQQDMATRVGGLEDTLYSQWIDSGKAVNRARENNQLQHLTFGGGDVPGLGQMGEVVKQKGINRKALEKELDAIESARAYTAGGAAGATLGSVGYGAYANSGNPAIKQSMTMPQPSSRGQMKKVQMPEASSTKPDCDPEGVQMSAQDHNGSKEAGLGSILKALAKGVYKTPRSLKGLALGGAGGYATGRQHGHQVGLEDGHEDAAKTVINLFHKKQAFMGIGGLAGMATAPEGEEDLSIGRGALRGAGTALGAGAGAGIGAIGGAGIGSIGGGLLGALAGALSKRRFGQTFGQAVGGGMAGGAMAGGGLGYLAGIPAGAIYGGIKGNKATKALLDKTAPIGEKKKKDKEDDKEVKEAAAVVLAQLKRNHNK